MGSKLIFPLLLLLLVSSTLASHTGGDYAISFDFKNENQVVMEYSQYSGSPLLIDVFATWCEPCKVEILHIKDIYEKTSDQINILSISIDPTDANKITDFKNQFDASWTFGVDYDEKLGEKYNITYASKTDTVGLPVLLLFDSSGHLIKKWTGVTETSAVYEQLRSNFGIEITDQDTNELFYVERLLDNTFFKITTGITILLIIYIILSNVVNRSKESDLSDLNEKEI